MKRIKYLSLAFPLLLLSCVSITGVVPVGPNVYEISGKNYSLGAKGGPIQEELFKRAAAYCALQNKTAERVGSTTVDYKVLDGIANADLTFRCFPKGTLAQ